MSEQKLGGLLVSSDFMIVLCLVLKPAGDRDVAKAQAGPSASSFPFPLGPAWPGRTDRLSVVWLAFLPLAGTLRGGPG